MRRRTMFRAFYVSMFTLTVTLLLLGCDGGSNSAGVPGNPIAGSYAGTYQRGTINFTVGSDGRVNATVQEGASTFTGTGEVDNTGRLSIRVSSSSNDDVFTGTFNTQTGALTTGPTSWNSCPACVKEGCLAPCTSDNWTVTKTG